MRIPISPAAKLMSGGLKIPVCNIKLNESISKFSKRLLFPQPLTSSTFASLQYMLLTKPEMPFSRSPQTSLLQSMLSSASTSSVTPWKHEFTLAKTKTVHQQKNHGV